MVVNERGEHGRDRGPIEVAQRPDPIKILEPVRPVTPRVAIWIEARCDFGRPYRLVAAGFTLSGGCEASEACLHHLVPRFPAVLLGIVAGKRVEIIGFGAGQMV